MLIRVEVEASSNKNRLEKLGEGDYFLKVKAPARQGLANKAVLEFLARELNTPTNSLKIVKGWRSPRKVIELTD